MKPFLYALSTCFHCQRAKKWLDENNVDYNFVYVDLAEGDERSKLVNEVQSMTGASQFPVLKVGEKHVVGFNEDKLKDLLEIK